MAIPCLFFFLLFFTALNIYGAFFASGEEGGRKEKKSSLALSHTLYAESQSRQKSATLLPFATFLFLLFFFVRRRREMQCPTRFTHWHWQAREESLSSSTLTEGRKKVDKPRRIELPSSYIPQKIFFFKNTHHHVCPTFVLQKGE